MCCCEVFDRDTIAIHMDRRQSEGFEDHYRMTKYLSSVYKNRLIRPNALVLDIFWTLLTFKRPTHNSYISLS